MADQGTVHQRQGPVGTQFGPRELSVLTTLLFYSIAMIVLPISSYFISKTYIFEGYFGASNGSIQAAVVTVVIIHIIIALYIRSAWREGAAEKPKDD